MYRSSFLAVFFAFTSFSEGFLLSEIFAARKGSQKSWLELSILGEPIAIEKLKVTIYRDKTSEPELLLRKDLSTKIIFEDKLLLAEERKLGFVQCLNPRVPVIEIAPLKLKSGQWQKICVELNNEERCAALGKQNKFSEGVSFYRNLNDENPAPLWLKEPCLLRDQIFASPGLDARFCASESTPIFEECPPKKGELKSFQNNSNSKPKIIGAHREKSEVVFQMSDENPDEAWRINFCVASKPESKLCHELDAAKSLFAPGEHRLGVPSWPKAMGTYLALSIRNLSGLSDKALLRE